MNSQAPPPAPGQPQINIVQKNSSGCRTLVFVCVGVLVAIGLVIGGCVVFGAWGISEAVEQVAEAAKEAEEAAKVAAVTAVSWDDVTNAQNPDNSLTDIQKEKLHSDIIDKRVRWSGSLVEVESTYSNSITLHVSMDGGSEAEVTVELFADQKEKAETLVKGEPVTFEGTVRDTGSKFRAVELKYGKISP